MANESSSHLQTFQGYSAALTIFLIVLGRICTLRLCFLLEKNLSMPNPIQIIDLFAGPGGLGEGFSAFKYKSDHPFKIAISIEKEKYAHQTLLLRSFFRQFKKVPNEYYSYLQGGIDRTTLFQKYPDETRQASKEAWLAELGSEDFPHEIVAERIKEQLSRSRDCVLIGGPPCQAYSLAGRSKMAKQVDFEDDPRHTLYREYLKIIAEFKPKIFVMENVKGILSSKLNDQLIFDRILKDLENPSQFAELNSGDKKTDVDKEYKIYSLVTGEETSHANRSDFTIKCEKYGIPQARHRVILLGIRSDITVKPKSLKESSSEISVEEAISDLPKLRSGLSKMEDTFENWTNEIQSYASEFRPQKVMTRGGEFLKGGCAPKYSPAWYNDERLKGVVNHETRSHMTKDLHRYYHLANQGIKLGVSPRLQDFPVELLPNHKNVKTAINQKSLFNDRFRVQIKNKPATTITSHISKDGHYFIHYDPKQCRSLTVREAARLQTFPDNYLFEGPRTSQYQQVGNAVPPILANQIAKIVYGILK